MSLRNWTEIQPTVFGNPKLSTKLRAISPKITKLADLVDPGADLVLGKKAGDQASVRIMGRIADDASTPIGEFSPVPFSKPPLFYVTATVNRYARAVAWTGEMEDLDRLDIRDSTAMALAEHYARTKNALIYAELVASRSFTYAPTGAAAGTFRSDGTIATSAAAPLTLWHLQNIAERLLDSNTPYADGDNYITALSPKAKFNIIMDTAAGGFTDVKKYSASGAEGVLKNEIGSVAQHRLIVDNDVLPNAIGTGSAYGSGFVTGWEACRELTVYPAHFRFNGNLGGDFGNQSGICWQSLEGWKGIWSYSTHGQGSICHLTST